MSGPKNAPSVLLAANYDADVGYAWNNIYRLFNAIMLELGRHGVRSCVSFPVPSDGSKVFDAGLDYQTLVFDWRNVTLARLWRLRPELRRLNVRYVYLTDAFTTRWEYAVLRLMGVRVFVIHSRISVPDPRPAPASRGLRGLVKAIMSRLPLATVDRVYTVSNFVRNRMLAVNRFPPGKVQTILNGIDVSRWEFPAAVLDPARGVTFFAASRAARYKGIGVLIEAAAQLRDVHGVKQFRVRYAGDGPDLAAFRQQVAQLGLEQHVDFLGKLASTRDEVCGCDVVVVPSAYGDACPSTVSEALASGRPLIATRAGGIPEIIGDVQNALIVEPNDVEQLAAAMAQLANSAELRATLGARGRARAQQALRRDAYHAKVVEALLRDFGIAQGRT